MKILEDDRVPPRKVRITKLQEQQIVHVRRIDRSSAEMYWEVGFDAAEVPVRTTEEIYHLPRGHAVRVAEADNEVAGWAAWRDEAPGVVYVEELAVDPAYHRFGIGTKLIERAYEEARENDFEELVLRTWDKAVWAKRFYKALGFRAIDDTAPPKVQEWLASKTDGGRPFLRPGESVLWARVPAPPPEEEEPEEVDDVVTATGDDDMNDDETPSEPR